jgi:hypothetical protein
MEERRHCDDDDTERNDEESAGGGYARSNLAEEAAPECPDRRVASFDPVDSLAGEKADSGAFLTQPGRSQ